jgi:hypothetical protein
MSYQGRILFVYLWRVVGGTLLAFWWRCVLDISFWLYDSLQVEHFIVLNGTLYESNNVE